MEKKLRPHRGDRGMAVAMVMAVLGAMMVVGVVGLGLSMASLRTAGAHRQAARALFCAEAGLAAGKVFFSANVGQWDPYLQCNHGAAPCPAGYPLTGSAATDGSASFSVSILDNYDELPPAANNPLVDNDLTVIMVSRCTDPLLPPRVLQEYVTLDVNQVSGYRAQAGLGTAHAGNEN